MARKPVWVLFGSKGAEKVKKDLKDVKKGQEKVEKQSEKTNETFKIGAEILDQLGLSGASALFSVGEGVTDLGKGFKGLKGAIAASGIGLLIIALTEGVQIFMRWISGADEAAEANRNFERSLDGIVTAQETLLKTFDNETEILKLRGADELELIERQKERLALTKAQTDERMRQHNENIAQLQQLKEGTDEYDEFNKNLLENEKALRAEIHEQNLQAIFLEEQESAARWENEKQRLTEEQAARDAINKARREAEAARIAALRGETAATEEAEMRRLELLQSGVDTQAEMTARKVELDGMEVESRESLLATLQHLNNNAVESAEDYAGGLAAVAELIGTDSKRAFNATKGLNIAETLISTYSAAQKAYQSQLALATPDAPVRAAIAAGTAVAQGLARVAAIRKTTFDGGGGGTPSSGGGAPRPAFAQFTPQVPNASLTTPEPAPVQAFVVGQNITNQQSLDAELVTQSRL